MLNYLFNMTPPDLYHFETIIHQMGYDTIAGIDEAGRGPLAGPVVAAAVILNPEQPVKDVNDSKRLNEKCREQLYLEIMELAVAVGVGIVDAATIDRINILQATRQAMLLAVDALHCSPDYLIIDGITPINSSLPQKTIKKGDSLSASIAAASIIAKVTRDRIMYEYDRLYPTYGFSSHKGYGTPQHLAALQKHGPSPIHRMTFRQVKNDKSS